MADFNEKQKETYRKEVADRVKEELKGLYAALDIH